MKLKALQSPPLFLQKVNNSGQSKPSFFSINNTMMRILKSMIGILLLGRSSMIVPVNGNTNETGYNNETARQQAMFDQVALLTNIDEEIKLSSQKGIDVVFEFTGIHEQYTPDTVLVQLYDKFCETGNGTTAIVYGEAGLRSSTLSPFDPITVNVTNNSAYVRFTIQTRVLRRTPIFQMLDPLTAEIKFCIRFALYMNGQEVNYIENVATVFAYLLENVMAFAGFDGSSKPVTEAGAAESQLNYGVEAYLCNGSDQVLNQGDIVSVCIVPNDFANEDGAVMESVDLLTWSRNDDDAIGYLEQPAVVGKNIVADGFLTSISVVSFPVIQVDTVLYAEFYRTSGSVSGAGTATLKFPDGNGNRRNLRERKVPIHFNIRDHNNLTASSIPSSSDNEQQQQQQDVSSSRRRRRRQLQQEEGTAGAAVGEGLGLVEASPFDIRVGVASIDDGEEVLPDLPESSTINKENLWLLIVLLVMILVVLTFIVYYFVSNNNIEQPKQKQNEKHHHPKHHKHGRNHHPLDDAYY